MAEEVDNSQNGTPGDGPRWEQPVSSNDPRGLHIVSVGDISTYVEMSLDELCDLLFRGNPIILTETDGSRKGKRCILMPSQVIYVNEESDSTLR